MSQWSDRSSLTWSDAVPGAQELEGEVRLCQIKTDYARQSLNKIKREVSKEKSEGLYRSTDNSLTDILK